MYVQQVTNASENVTEAFLATYQAEITDAINNHVCWKIITMIIVVLIFFGNMLIILAVILTPRLRNVVANYFIFNLAVSDVLVGIAITFNLSFYWNSNLGKIKEVCLLRYVILAVAGGASMYSIIAIGLDRFFAIVHPLKYKVYATSTRVILMIIGVWIITIILGAIPSFWNNYKDSCDVQLVYARYFVVGFQMPLMCVNWSILFSLYWMIWRAAHLSALRMNATAVSSAADKNERKSIQVVIILIGCFTVCLMPYFILTCFRIFHWNTSFLKIMYRITYMLAILNSALNPVIYAWKNSTFRYAFLGILTCRSPNKILNSNLKKQFKKQQEMAKKINKKMDGYCQINGSVNSDEKDHRPIQAVNSLESSNM